MGNIFTVTFPDIGEGVVEGEVIEWHKKVGDSIKQDESVVVVMTDKATVELPSPHPGILAKQYFAPGEMAIRDRPLYDIELIGNPKAFNNNAPDSEQENASESGSQTDSHPASALTKNHAADGSGKIATACAMESISTKEDASNDPNAQFSTTMPAQSQATTGKNLATPKVRGLAKVLEISLTDIRGSGKDGRVIPQDLTRKIRQDSDTKTMLLSLPGDEEIPVIGIKARMAKKMAESKEMIPSFSYFEEVEVTQLVKLKANMKAKALNEGVHLTYMPFILRALSASIIKYPVLNSSFDKERSKLILHRTQNIGIAVASPLGLIVPVLKGVEKLSLEPLIRRFEELVLRAQQGKLHSNDMKEGTLTVSNFGSNGSHGLWATPVINYPEVAILAIGKIHPQAVVRNGEVAIRDILNLSWSFDHRVIDGEAATHISQYFCSLLQNPATLL
ncbi:MAG: 2-oxo acid dehydrogenase subunit E2 [Parachlamydiaceae bacterium]|nr:2-oxo acid dehydrogenase subunit E2 [Parachlamydiaceae bacterium]